MRKPLLVVVITLLLALLGGVAWVAGILGPDDGSGPALAWRAGPDGDGARTGPTELAGGERERAGARAVDETAVEPAPLALVEPGRPERAPLSGRVIDPSGAPVPGARVLLGLSSGGLEAPLDSEAHRRRGMVPPLETRTDATGTFRFAQRWTGNVRLGVRAPGYAPWDRERVHVPAGRDHRLEDVVLEPGAAVRGAVLDADGVPVAGAHVLRPDDAAALEGAVGLEPAGARLATTDDAGTFEARGLATGDVLLWVTTSEHPDALHPLAALAPGEVRDVVVRLPRGAAIEGTVRAADPALLREIVVAATRLEAAPSVHRMRTARPDDLGRFRVAGLLPDEEYDVHARRREAPAASNEALTPRVRARSGTRGVELRLAAAPDLCLRVVDARTGAPVEVFSLAITGTDDQGRRLESQHYPPGDRKLRREGGGRTCVGELSRFVDQPRLSVAVTAEGYAPRELAGLRLPATGTLDLRDVELEPVPALAVRVVDATTREPLAGAAVHARAVGVDRGRGRGLHELRPEDVLFTAGRSQERTGADGRARPAGDGGLPCWVWAAHPDRAPSWPVRVEPGAGEVEVALGPGGSLEVLAQDARGEPLDGVEVALALPAAPAEDAGRGAQLAARRLDARATDSQGRVVFERLVPTAYQVELLADGEARERLLAAADPDAGHVARVDVADGARASVTLVAPATGRVAGTVRESGRPLAGAEVALAPLADARRPRPLADALLGLRGTLSARTDGSGAFELADVRVGDYTLVVEHPDRAMAATRTVHVIEGDNALAIELELTVLAGRVVGPDGRAVIGATVTVGTASRNPADPTIPVADAALAVPGPMQLRGASAETDARGEFELRGVAAGQPLELEVQAQGFRTVVSEAVTLAEGERRAGIVLELHPAGAVNVRLLTADGRPAPGCLVRATPAGDAAAAGQVAVTDASGRALLEGLAPGRWRVEARPRARPEEAVGRETDVRAGARVDVELRLEP